MSRPTAQVVTPIGTVSATPTDGSHIYVEGSVTVRGKTQRMTMHLHRWSDGQFHLGQENTDKWKQLTNFYGDSTVAFRDRAIAEVVPAINAWAATNLNMLDEAQAEHMRNAIANRKKQISEHERAIAVLRDELQRLEAGEAVGSYPQGVKMYYFEKDRG